MGAFDGCKDDVAVGNVDDGIDGWLVGAIVHSRGKIGILYLTDHC